MISSGFPQSWRNLESHGKKNLPTSWKLIVNVGRVWLWQPSRNNISLRGIRMPLGCCNPYQNGPYLIMEKSNNGLWKVMEFHSQISVGSLHHQLSNSHIHIGVSWKVSWKIVKLQTFIYIKKMNSHILCPWYCTHLLRFMQHDPSSGNIFWYSIQHHTLLFR